MQRQWFQEEHEIFRQSFVKYLEKEVRPYFDDWEEEGMVPREAWKKLSARASPYRKRSTTDRSASMYVVCLDLEGVLIPEIWINFAEATGIDELRLTTRDIPDYDVLMKKRLDILSANNLKLADIQKVIGTMNPLEGAKEFLDELRGKTQVVILSDTFTQFARPMMEKLAWPTLFCNSLVIDDQDRVVDYKLRQQDGKRHAVEGFQGMNLKVIAAGDSYNDLSMIKKAQKGILFCPPDSIVEDNPGIPVARNYKDFMAHIDEELNKA